MTDDTLPKTLEVTPRTFHSGLENLKREVANARPQPDPKPTSLAPKDIRFATSVFQPRTFEGKTAESEAHVDALKDAIRNSPNNLLDPIEVWWSGQSWKVLDGHHRLIAYRRLATDRRKPLVVHSIPVVVFEGTLNQAIARATELNSRDKMPMTRDEKLERAWKLVCLNDPSLSRPAIAAIAGVSDRVVGTMRAARDEFIRTKPRRNILDLTWDDIKRGGKRDTQFNDSWRERQAEAWVKGFKKNFGGKIIKHPEVFAMAIKLYSDSLPRRMIEGAWEDIAVEVVDAMREDEVEMRPAPGDDHDDDAF